MAPQNLPKTLIDLKILPVCSERSMVNLQIYGQSFIALYCQIAVYLEVRWNPPPAPTIDLAKKLNLVLSEIDAIKIEIFSKVDF